VTAWVVLDTFAVLFGYFAHWAKPDSLPRWQKFRRWLAGVDGDDAQPFLPRFGKTAGSRRSMR
jgi:hypothetical protein